MGVGVVSPNQFWEDQASQIIVVCATQWDFRSQPQFHGLYRLGFEEEQVLAELNQPLSAHEKMELRLSFPREFWPKAWLEKGHDSD